MINQKEILKIKEKHSKFLFIAGFTIISIWGIICLTDVNQVYILRHLFTGRNPFSNIVYGYGPIIRLICYLISLILSMAIIGIVPNKNMKNITTYGKKTMQIFSWHYPVIYILFSFFNFRILCKNIYGKLIFLEIATIVSIILTNKIFSFPTKQIINWSKQNE